MKVILQAIKSLLAGIKTGFEHRFDYVEKKLEETIVDLENINEELTEATSVLEETTTKADSAYTRADAAYRSTASKANRENPSFSGSISLGRAIPSTNGTESVAIGNDAKASGANSVALGRNAVASGNDSFAIGSGNVASGPRSLAEGSNTEATKEGSHAEGVGTVANFYAQHVQGRYNIIGESAYAHIVGNGTSDENRSNAHTLDFSGNAWFAGAVECQQLRFATPNGGQYTLSVNSDGELTVTVNSLPGETE